MEGTYWAFTHTQTPAPNPHAHKHPPPIPYATAAQLKRDFPNDLLPKLPRKKLWGDNFDPDFIKQRRQGLQQYIQQVLNHKTWARRCASCFIAESSFSYIAVLRGARLVELRT